MACFLLSSWFSISLLQNYKKKEVDIVHVQQIYMHEDCSYELDTQLEHIHHCSQTSQQEHWTTESTSPLKFFNSIFRLHLSLFWQYSFMASSRNRLEGCGTWKRIARAGKPSRPARPDSCMYCSISFKPPQWMILRTLGQSSPIPKATVATTMRRIPLGRLNEARMASFTGGWVQAVNMSTSLNRAKSGD